MILQSLPINFFKGLSIVLSLLAYSLVGIESSLSHVHTWNHSISMTQNKVIATCSIEHELRSYLVSLPVKEKKNKSENHFHKHW